MDLQPTGLHELAKGLAESEQEVNGVKDIHLP